jgi:exodeoxyribonuclease VII small subunit
MTKKSYSSLNQQLEDLMEELQSDNLDLDEAMNNYEKAMITLKEIEDHINHAENKFQKIYEKFKGKE